jgi:hypothetical protein
MRCRLLVPTNNPECSHNATLRLQGITRFGFVGICRTALCYGHQSAWRTKMQNGLYAAEFQTPLGNGHGVVMLLNGVLQGGDSMMYYQGNYIVDGSSFKADVTTGAHAHPPGMSSVFGRDRVTINLSGTFAGDTLTANGSAAEVPNVNFSAKLKLIAVGSGR